MQNDPNHMQESTNYVYFDMCLSFVLTLAIELYPKSHCKIIILRMLLARSLSGWLSLVRLLDLLFLDSIFLGTKCLDTFHNPLLCLIMLFTILVMSSSMALD